MPRADKTGNLLLDALPASLRKLHAHLESVPLTAKQVVHSSDRPVDFVYFPTGGMISIAARAAGATVQVGAVGREGMVGISAVLGAPSSPHEAIVTAGGNALRLPASVCRQRTRLDKELQSVLLRYAHLALTHAAQLAACNARHSLDARLARWLLSAHDRLGPEALPVSHDFIARLLGVRRPSVTEWAGRLQEAGAIAYGRGRLALLDRPAVERLACDCYRVLRRAERQLVAR